MVETFDAIYIGKSEKTINGKDKTYFQFSKEDNSLYEGQVYGEKDFLNTLTIGNVYRLAISANQTWINECVLIKQNVTTQVKSDYRQKQEDRQEDIIAQSSLKEATKLLIAWYNQENKDFNNPQMLEDLKVIHKGIYKYIKNGEYKE